MNVSHNANPRNTEVPRKFINIGIKPVGKPNQPKPTHNVRAYNPHINNVRAICFFISQPPRLLLLFIITSYTKGVTR
jgi:hypothetical protein